MVDDLATGTLRYDNFQGRWGDTARLDSFRHPAYKAVTSSVPFLTRSAAPGGRARLW